jgi:plastocyanin
MRGLIALALLAGCTTGSTPPATPPPSDAPPVDAPPAVVELSRCPDTVAGTVMDSATAFIPKDTTITVGQVVEFVITAEHFVIPNTLTTTDPALNVGRGQTKCFQFNTAGTYGFLCGVHSFTGTIVVQ